MLVRRTFPSRRTSRGVFRAPSRAYWQRPRRRAASGRLTVTATASVPLGALTATASATTGGPLLSALTDDFTTEDTTKWSGYDITAATGGQLVIPCTNGYYALLGNSTYTLTGSGAFVELVQPPNVGNGTTGCGFILAADNGNGMRFWWEGGNLQARYHTASVEQATLASVAYSSTNHRWLKLSESGGTLTWATSPNGTTWTTFTTLTNPWAITPVKVIFNTGYYGTETTPGNAVYDNLNLTAAATVNATASAPLGGLAGSATATKTVAAAAAASLGGLSAAANAVPTVYATAAAPLGGLRAAVATYPLAPRLTIGTGGVAQLDGQPYRSGGIDIFQLALNDYPTNEITPEADVDALLDKALALKAYFVRAHTLGASVGPNTGTLVTGVTGTGSNPTIVYNNDAWTRIDYAIAAAVSRGIKLIVPLVDELHYYHGGKANWVYFRDNTVSLDPNVKSANNSTQRTKEQQFFTNTQMLADFRKYVSDWLNHVNAYTGRANKDEPAIAIIETGNEMWTAKDTPGWTDGIAQYIKSIAPNTLVMEGGTDGLVTADMEGLDSDYVDLIGTHPYNTFTPSDVEDMAADAAAAGKGFVIGEYAWAKTTAADLEQLTRDTPNILTSCPWSLQLDDDLHNGGIPSEGGPAYGTSDDNPLYVPGRDSTNTAAVTRITAHGAALMAVTATASAPLGGLTGSATAVRTVPATASSSLGGLAATASATTTRSATAAAALGALTGTASTVTTVFAAASAPLGPLSAQAAATRTLPATASAPLGQVTATASGTNAATAAATAPLGGLTAAAAAGVTPSGTATAPLGPLAATATATATHPAVAVANLGALTGSAAATVTAEQIDATAIAPLGGVVGVATATRTVSATATAPLGGLTAAAAGDGQTLASATGPLGGLTASASGVVTRAATVSAALGALSAAAVATAQTGATGSADLGPLTATGTAAVEHGVAGVAALGPLAAVATPTTIVTATAQAALGALTGAGIIRVDVIAQAAAGLGALVATATGFVGNPVPGKLRAGPVTFGLGIRAGTPSRIPAA